MKNNDSSVRVIVACIFGVAALILACAVIGLLVAWNINHGNKTPIGFAGQTWTPKGQPSTIGDITIRISSIEVKHMNVRKGGLIYPCGGEPTYNVYLSIENKSDTNKASYLSWVDSLAINAGAALLQDEFGNSYNRFRPPFASDYIDALKDRTTIAPNGRYSEVIPFEQPIPKATKLYLTLPASNVGEGGNFRFEIPVK